MDTAAAKLLQLPCSRDARNNEYAGIWTSFVKVEKILHWISYKQIDVPPVLHTAFCYCVNVSTKVLYEQYNSTATIILSYTLCLIPSFLAPRTFFQF